MADDEIAVTIEDEGNGSAAEAEGKTTPAEPIEDLKAQRDELQAARQRDADRAATAERAAALARNQAREAAAEAATLRQQVAERSGESIDAGIAAANEAIEAATKEIKTAGEAGDYGALAAAQAKLSRASARLERLSEQKTGADIRKAEAARPRREQAQDEAAREAPADPFEQMLAEMAQNGGARSADWIRRNRDAWADEKKNAKIRAAHFDAVADGIKPESDEYFEYVERRVGLREADPAPKPGNGRVEVRTHSRRPPVAPVTESGGSMNGGSGTTVRLTQGQAKAATDGTLVWNYDDPTGKGRFKKGDPIGHQEMARRVLEQTKQGLYDPNNIQA